MTRAGAPLRFLALVLGGWIALRVVLLWPGAAVEALAPAPLRPVAQAAAKALASSRAAVNSPGPAIRIAPAPPSIAPAAHRHVPPARTQPTMVAFASVAPLPPAPSQQPASPPPRRAGVTLGLASYVRVGGAPPAARPPTPPRLSGSAWAIVRGAGSAAVATPQLGGSQAGVRLAYALGDARRIAATLRIAGALGQPDREIAPGIEWRVPHLPLRLFAEQRIALARNRGGTAAGIIIGVTRALPGAIVLDGYAQGGIIRRDGVEGFADGALRAARPIARAGPVLVDVGAGAWGAAQRGAARVDLGPTLGARVPLAGHVVRASLDWRVRVAGNARPASGPALSLGTDF